MDLALPMGQAYTPGPNKPPMIEVNRGPGLVERDAQVTLSGVARDDQSVRDVIVYARSGDTDEKVFYQGGTAGTTSIPWTVDATLKPGSNLFVILTRDGQGLTDIRSVSVWHDPTGAAASAATLPVEGWPAQGQAAVVPAVVPGKKP